MKRADKPGCEFALAMRDSLANMAGVVHALTSPECSPADSMMWASRVMTCFDAVRGNRPVDTPVSWDDLRLMTAAAMRLFLGELERTDTHVSPGEGS